MAVEVNGIYYHLEDIRTCQPPNSVFLADSRAAPLSLKASDSKTAYSVPHKAILNENDILQRQGHTIAYQQVPDYVRVHEIR